MADTFDLLDKCDVKLPVATVVDSITFTRLATIQIDYQGKAVDAVYPSDRAFPDRVKTRIEGWPPEDLVKARGGLPLDELWDPVPDEAKSQPAVRAEVGDVDDFVANPSVQIDADRVQLSLSPEHVKLLTTQGRALVTAPNGKNVLVQAIAGVGDVGRSSPTVREVHVSDVASLASARGLRVDGKQIALSGAEIRALRRGSEVLITPRGGGDAVRVVPTGSAASAGTSPENGTASYRSMTAVTPGTEVHVFKTPDESSFAQPLEPLPKLRFCIHTTYVQEWTLAGFARGDLINSIGLAPQEETTIDIFSWDRRRITNENTAESSFEQSLDTGWTQRLTRDVVRELTQTEVARLTSAGVDIPLPDNMKLGLNMTGDFGSQLVTAAKDSAGWVAEATSKAAARTRGLRQTKVTENQEWGTETRTTRRLRNQNLSRTITYDLFEMLAAYDVATVIVPAETRLCVLVPSPLPVKLFERRMVIAYEGTLRRALLDAYQEDGFDAARWLDAREEYRRLESLRPKAPAKDTAPAAPGQTSSPTPPAPPTPDAVLRAGDEIAAAVRALRDARHTVASAYDGGARGAALEPAILEFRRWMFRRFPLTMTQPAFWASCLEFEKTWSVPNGRNVGNVDNFLVHVSGSWTEVAGRIALTLIFPPAIQFIVGYVLEQYVAELGWKSGWYMQFWGFDDAGLGAAMEGARGRLAEYRKAQLAGAGLPPADPPKQTATDTTKVDDTAKDTPAEPFADQDAAERIVAERALLAHLEAHRSHYLDAIWKSFMPLDQARYVQMACGNLAEDTVPEVIGFQGNEMIVPFVADRYPQTRQALAKAIAYLAANAPAPVTRRIVLATPGVQLEARLGLCDAVEPYVAELRQIDLDDRRAKMRQSRLEVRRMRQRLTATPPQLENPLQSTAGLTVKVENGSGPTP